MGTIHKRRSATRIHRIYMQILLLRSTLPDDRWPIWGGGSRTRYYVPLCHPEGVIVAWMRLTVFRVAADAVPKRLTHYVHTHCAPMYMLLLIFVSVKQN